MAADTVTPDVRSRMMAGIRGKDTKPEKAVRSALHRLGFRFRVHRKDLPGKPDLVLPKHKAVIFVHGCFWHGHSCKRGNRRPKSNAEYWKEKIEGNVGRHARQLDELAAGGWSALTVWECELGDVRGLEKRLNAFLLGAHVGALV